MTTTCARCQGSGRVILDPHHVPHWSQPAAHFRPCPECSPIHPASPPPPAPVETPPAPPPLPVEPVTCPKCGGRVGKEFPGGPESQFHFNGCADGPATQLARGTPPAPPTPGDPGETPDLDRIAAVERKALEHKRRIERLDGALRGVAASHVQLREENAALRSQLATATRERDDLQEQLRSWETDIRHVSAALTTARGLLERIAADTMLRSDIREAARAFLATPTPKEPRP